MRRGRSEALDGTNLLDIAPVRTADWEEKGGRIVVLRPKPRRRGIKGALDWLLHLMSARKIKLDEIGTFAWLRLDGVQTVAQVAHQIEREFGDRVRPAEEKLGYLVRVLRREGLLGYPGWDDSVDRVEPAKRLSSED